MKDSRIKRVRERWKQMLYGFLGRIVLSVIGKTCRYRVTGTQGLVDAASSGKCILMFWHNRLTMIANILKRCAPQFTYAALISDSKDGEVISVLVNSYRNGRSIRVPHNARSQALQTLVRELATSQDIFIITPDGPRGPACRVKPGIVFAAQKAGAEVVPMTWSASRCWYLPTWDGMFLPKPFSTIEVRLGEAVSIGDNAKEEIKKLESALFSLERR